MNSTANQRNNGQDSVVTCHTTYHLQSKAILFYLSKHAGQCNMISAKIRCPDRCENNRNKVVIRSDLCSGESGIPSENQVLG